MKVFLDTNVLVSAFTTRGLCADVLRLVLAEHVLLSGEVILEELQQVLLERFQISRPVNQGIIELLRSQAVIIPRPASPVATGVRDPDDEWVIASALLGKADVLVSGDKDMLVLKRIGSLSIHDPRGFWEYLKKL
ncbi:MAG: putative toxin-antitoxin system toxin component, PIN family [Gammaproteobacteria bacterium]